VHRGIHFFKAMLTLNPLKALRKQTSWRMWQIEFLFVLILEKVFLENFFEAGEKIVGMVTRSNGISTLNDGSLISQQFIGQWESLKGW
jgi:hypothetical protein